MLKLSCIKKDYLSKSQPTVHALKGISLRFRPNEFVAILGHSGCGKTTLLNIMGGLDRYSDGDLLIKGKSTKDYTDRDWDTYRNHSIGFVFQTYNLIPHQSILKNVELALTIGGVNKIERKERAIKALEDVGLKGLEKKKPNQLSGGQMQRVAIARALVNSPEIVLADEPTGALDSETSVQIMDLLKEVAKHRLVIMVTHNPELAEKYATRIVRMKDGLIVDDTNPYSDEEAKKVIIQDIDEIKKDKSLMKFKTAFGLSASNLASKIKRTTLIAIAGSIGIIGVSSVLAVSQGIQKYVDSMQDDMLSNYPLTVAEESLDYTSLMAGLSNWEKAKVAIKPGFINMDSMISYLMEKYSDLTRVNTNLMTRELLDYINNIPEEYVSTIAYGYGIDMTNNIFTTYKRNAEDEERMMSLNGLTYHYIASLQTVNGFEEYANYVGLFLNFMNQLPENEEYVMRQYDLLAGKYATEENEILLVVDSDTSLTDITLGQMGFFFEEDFTTIAQNSIKNNDDDPDNDVTEITYPTEFSYEELMDKTLMYYPNSSIYQKMTLPSGEQFAYNSIITKGSEPEGGMPLHISGILRKKSGLMFGALQRGVYYTSKLTKRMLLDNALSNLDNNSIAKEFRTFMETESDDLNGAYAKAFKANMIFDYADHRKSGIERYGHMAAVSIAGGQASGLSILGTTASQYEKNIQAGRKLGIVPIDHKEGMDDVDLPTSISIYPTNFENKDNVTAYLDAWNVDLEETGKSELKYTDTIGLIINLVNTLIEAITIALICFTSLSLVVSCFMIAVITYISTVERIKEIGVIRSLGGRKKDVSRLFIAETMIIGLASGLIGIGVTYVLQGILNVAVKGIGAIKIADLSLWTAGCMVLTALGLNVISGLIPSAKAAKQDPVVALRSE